jgi:hypothetical protein
LKRKKDTLLQDRDNLDKERNGLTTKIETLKAFNEKQKIEADHMLKSLVEEGANLKAKLSKASKIIEQRERREKRATEGLGAYI